MTARNILKKNNKTYIMKFIQNVSWSLSNIQALNQLRKTSLVTRVMLRIGIETEMASMRALLSIVT